jgi:hypothetical protein
MWILFDIANVEVYPVKFIERIPDDVVPTVTFTVQSPEFVSK